MSEDDPREDLAAVTQLANTVSAPSVPLALPERLVSVVRGVSENGIQPRTFGNHWYDPMLEKVLASEDLIFKEAWPIAIELVPELVFTDEDTKRMSRQLEAQSREFVDWSAMYSPAELSRFWDEWEELISLGWFGYDFDTYMEEVSRYKTPVISSFVGQPAAAAVVEHDEVVELPDDDWADVAAEDLRTWVAVHTKSLLEAQRLYLSWKRALDHGEFRDSYNDVNHEYSRSLTDLQRLVSESEENFRLERKAFVDRGLVPPV